MDPSVHQILRDAGVAKGIAKDEVSAWAVLTNEHLLRHVQNELTAQHERDELNADEYAAARDTLVAAAERMRSAQHTFATRVGAIQKSATETFVQDALERKKERVEKIQKLDTALRNILDI